MGHRVVSLQAHANYVSLLELGLAHIKCEEEKEGERYMQKKIYIYS
jgi:hypothetical protein